MPEWMEDSHDSDGQLISATFEQDGTFTGLPSVRETNSNEKSKAPAQPSATADEASTHTRAVSVEEGSRRLRTIGRSVAAVIQTAGREKI